MRKLIQIAVINLLIGIIFLIGYLIVRANHDTLEFEDAQLEMLVRELIELETGQIRRSAVRHLTTLDATGQEIQSLEGIQGIANLRVVILEDNAIRDVSPLAALPNLTELNLRNNGIVNLASANFHTLHQLPELRVLSLRHNVIRLVGSDIEQVRLSNISLLAGLVHLENLDLQDNSITDLTPLASLTNLRVIDLSQNKLGSHELLVFSHHPNLERLNLRDTNLTDLSPLATLTNLKYLNLHSNQDVISIEPLKSLVNLETLILRHVPIGNDIVHLQNMVNLRRLNVRQTGILNVHVIASLMSLGALQDDLSKNVYAEVDLRENPILDSAQGYQPLEPYWYQVSNRFPRMLPEDPTQVIFINEFMASNASRIMDEDGDRPDWIELYNPQNVAVDLSHYYLSDSEVNPLKWQFPMGTIIPANGYLIVFASGKDRVGTNGEIHTSFRLDITGEPILLIEPNGITLVDYIPPVHVPRDYSYGRFPDGSSTFVYFYRHHTTPGSTNNHSLYQINP